jgi:PiT family inorganic phosphate transporter
MEFLALALVALLAYANGSNDLSKGIATLIGSGVTRYRRAILWGTAWTVVGGGIALRFSTAMIATFSHWVNASTQPIAFPLAVLLAASLWVLLSSLTGLPVSTTHAITGAVLGAGVAAFGRENLRWGAFASTLALPLFLSPFVALAAARLAIPFIRRTFCCWKGQCLCLGFRARPPFFAFYAGLPSVDVDVVGGSEKFCDVRFLGHARLTQSSLHWLTSGFTSLARGLNDAPKMVAFGALLGALMESPRYLGSYPFLFGWVALFMGLGSLVGGFKVTWVLAERITKMDAGEGFTANLVTSVLVGSAAVAGLPLSTTHVSSTAIMGVGLQRGRGINRRTVAQIVLAWGATLPASAGMAALLYLLLGAVL